MPRSKLLTDFRSDRGSASLEFITAGMILLVPVVYLVLVMASLQAGSLAVEAASRQAVRVFVQADDSTAAARSAERAIRFALADSGLESTAATIRFDCEPDPRNCLEREGFVTVTISTSVPLPLVPPALSIDQPLAIDLSATATQQVSRFWGAR